MPSPVGHSLIGCATGILILVPRGARPGLASRLWNVRGWLLGGVVVANAPDIDFLPGILIGELNAFHHGPSHSLAWALLLAAGIGALAHAFRPGKGMAVAGGVFVLIAGHLLADWLCQDFAEPFGLPLFWPVDPEYRLAPVSVFLAMEKARIADVFSAANWVPAWRELWVGALCMTAALVTRLGRGSRAGFVEPGRP